MNDDHAVDGSLSIASSRAVTQRRELTGSGVDAALRFGRQAERSVDVGAERVRREPGRARQRERARRRQRDSLAILISSSVRGGTGSTRWRVITSTSGATCEAEPSPRSRSSGIRSDVVHAHRFPVFVAEIDLPKPDRRRAPLRMRGPSLVFVIRC